MEIRQIETQSELTNLVEDWRTLQIWMFGPTRELGYIEDANAYVGFVNDEPVAYLIADGRELWHIETRADHTGNGYAQQLAEHAKIDFAWEVCSDAGAAFCEALGIPYEDCR